MPTPVTMTLYTDVTTPSLNIIPHMEELANTIHSLTELLPTTTRPTQPHVRHGGFYAVAIALTIMSLIGILQNTLTLVALNKRKNPLWVEFLIKVLLLSDLMTCVLALPFSITLSFMGRWLFGSVGCNLYSFSMCFTGAFSINVLTSISVERYFTIEQIMQIPLSNKTRVQVTSLVVSALGALVWSLLPLVGVSSYKPEGIGATCSVDWRSKRPQDQAYLVVILICCFVIPLSIVIFCYSHIYIKVTSRPWAAKLSKKSQMAQRRIKMEIHLVKTIFLVSGFFILAWSPYAIVSLIAIFTDQEAIPPIVISISALFAKSSIFFNGFVYVFMNNDLRHACLQYLRLKGDRVADKQVLALACEQKQSVELCDIPPKLIPRDACSERP